LADAGARAGQRQAVALVAGLIEGGANHAVISPGSRSTPLALACLREPSLTSRVMIDERSAAFFALGIARVTGRPVIVVATSGSAPANWYPAVIEAHEDNLPLVLVSADRPAELLDCGANQTTDQAGLFGGRARGCLVLPAADDNAAERDTAHAAALGVRAANLSLWPRPGPVHVNAAFREPLVDVAVTDVSQRATQSVPTTAIATPQSAPAARALDEIADTFSEGQGVIVCGPCKPGTIDPPALLELADKCGAPVLADPLSGIRFGPWPKDYVITGFDAFLRHAPPARHDWIVQFGSTPTSAALQRWIANPGSPRPIVVAAQSPWSDPSLRSRLVVLADPSMVVDSLLDMTPPVSRGDWLKKWRRADNAVRLSLGNTETLPVESRLMEAIARHLPASGTLFLGNSMVVRDADSFLRSRDQPMAVFGNRGVSGIDGNVSTALGIAAATTEPMIAVVGDVALFHDLNALALAAEQAMTVVVINNGGGAIFGYLAQRDLPEFAHGWLTPPGLDMEKVAAAFGLEYHRVATGGEAGPTLEATVAAGHGVLVDFVVDRDASLMAHRAWWQSLGARLPAPDEDHGASTR
jgi:2-succinyl-5-enolpyruvyl-6-hydroxy-3-cyclohexene-1-carboxylate synthase